MMEDNLNMKFKMSGNSVTDKRLPDERQNCHKGICKISWIFFSSYFVFRGHSLNYWAKTKLPVVANFYACFNKSTRLGPKFTKYYFSKMTKIKNDVNESCPFYCVLLGENHFRKDQVDILL